MHFMTALRAAWQAHDSLLCVGLDPDPARFPPSLRDAPDGILRFCTAIVDATADLVCCFKPQIAYFASRRAEDQLEALIDHIHTRHPGLPVILDAKRGDIGSTATHYAREAFERLYFEHHLRVEGSNMTRIAEKCGLERTHLYRKMKQLGLQIGRRSEE